MKKGLSPFVKWAGGKKQLIERLRDRMPLEYGKYYEPFIGGGALFLDIQPERAVINDVNKQLINIYRQLKNNSEKVIEELKKFDSIDCDKDYYIQMREKYNEKIILNELDIESAALMIWINKHCFNGLYRVNSKGLFNVPYNNKVSGSSMDEENLRNIGSYLRDNDIEIREGDFEDACSDVEAGDFVYIDSPYIPVKDSSGFTDYTKNGFSIEDHYRVSEMFKKLDSKGAKVMLSNHDVELVYELYKDYNIEVVDVRRAINRDASKRVGKEVIITNYENSVVEKKENKKENKLEYYYETENEKLILGDTFDSLKKMDENTVDMIFADPPYFLSNDGTTCKAGKIVSVNKGDWDKISSLEEKHKFNRKWIRLCKRVLKDNGTIWISGTMHNIYSVGMALEEEGFKIINNITWQKTNPPPNLACRCFTHSTETILWAKKEGKKSKHYFNYKLMKELNDGKQMKDVWVGSLTPKREKINGNHPNQKPLYILERIILASTKEGDTILDPFCGSSTTGIAAKLLNRKYIGIDNSEEYILLSKKRLENGDNV